MRLHNPFFAKGVPAAFLCAAALAVVAAAIPAGPAAGASQGTDSRRGYEIEPCKGRRCAAKRPVELTALRNLQSAAWLRDMEIELKNVSARPVYFVRLVLKMPDVRVEGAQTYGFSLTYGSPELAQVTNLARPGDAFIPPGGTVTLKVPEAKWKGFESYSARVDLPGEATRRVRFRIDTVSFGDGSGHIFGGVPFARGQSASAGCTQDYKAVFMKASFVPAAMEAPAPEPQSCFPSGCGRREERAVWCRYQDNGNTGGYLCEQYHALNSSDPQVPCSRLGERQTFSCGDSWWTCYDDTLEDCS